MYTIRRRVDDRLHALQLLPRELARDDEARLRFEREASLLRRLEGAHVCRVLDAGIHDDTPWIVTDLADQAPHLGRLFGQRRILSHVETLLCLEQIGSALRSARDVGLIHGDLRPENVRLVPSGRRYGGVVLTAKVQGFGLARLAALAGLGPPDLVPSNLPRWRWIARRGSTVTRS